MNNIDNSNFVHLNYSCHPKLNPNNSDTWYNKGTAIGKAGKFKDSIPCFDEAIKLNPNYFDAWYNKGFALKIMGKIEESEKCFEFATLLKQNK